MQDELNENTKCMHCCEAEVGITDQPETSLSDNIKMDTGFYTYLKDSELLEKWRTAAEALEELVSDNEKLDKLIAPGMDASCAPICNAMNLIPGVHTMSSCEGHGEDCFFVMFYCSQMPSLHFLCDVFKESIIAKKPDGSIFKAEWDEFELSNWHSICLRCFENVEFCVSSNSIGLEKDQDYRHAASTEFAKIIAIMAKDYYSNYKNSLK